MFELWGQLPLNRIERVKKSETFTHVKTDLICIILDQTTLRIHWNNSCGKKVNQGNKSY